jgi:twitching motility protein PilT
MMRINGKLRPMLEYPKLSPEDTAAISAQVMNLRQKKDFKETHECDLAYSLAGVSRFRVNIFQQRGTVGMVFRTIQTRIKTVRELMLPAVLENLCGESRGMILVTGATGSGKSTSLAAMLDYINAHKAQHIITIEDPIEYLHKDKQSIVNQREVGTDTMEFKSALRSSLRQDPWSSRLCTRWTHSKPSTA